MDKIFIGLFMFVAIGITGVSGAAQSEIEGVIWQLTELNGKNVVDARAYIEFDEAEMRASGNAGCNRFFGRYEISGRDLNMSGVGSTRMACVEREAMATEREFLKALGAATQLRQNGNDLTLSKGKTRLMRFKAMSKEDNDASDVTTYKWILTSVQGNAVALNKDAPFLNFDSEKKSAGGNSGCNVFGGNYEIDGSTVKFSQMISTMRACEFEDRMTIERDFFNGLQNAERIEISGKKLTIFNGKETLLEFEGVAK